MRNCFFIGLFAFFFAAQARAYTHSAPLPPTDTAVRVIGLPILFYTPDTRWGAGAGGVLSFRGEPLRSSVTFSFAFTQRKQFLLWFPYQYFSKRGRYRAFGEVGWFRYIFQYFGVGNGYAPDYLEKYTAQFPRLRVTALRRLKSHQYAGIRLGMDQYRITESELGGDIAGKRIVGAGGGFSASGGFAWVLDSRNSPFYPSSGWLIDAALTGEHPSLTGSDFSYLRWTFDAARYRQLSRNTILAAQVIGDFTQGNAPFFLLPALGGTKKLRGYPDGKYRDRNMALVQAELRTRLVWRLKTALFAGAGAVWGTPGHAVRLRPNGGAGLRFELDRKQQIHVRADYGIGDGVSGFYLTVGEAF